MIFNKPKKDFVEEANKQLRVKKKFKNAYFDYNPSKHSNYNEQPFRTISDSSEESETTTNNIGIRR